MLPSTLWQREIAEVLANRRSLFIKLTFPLATGGSFLLVAPPGFYTATVITIIAAFVGCFGAGITLSKSRSDGMLQRVALTPLSPRRIVLELVGASSLIDFCQLLPLVLVLAIKFDAYDFRLPALLVALAAAILAANLLGFIVALFARAPGEAMLYSSLVLFPTLYLAGLFSPVETNAGVRGFIAWGIPFYYLQQALLDTVGETAVWSSLRVTQTSIVAGCLVVLATALIAPRLVRTEPQ